MATPRKDPKDYLRLGRPSDYQHEFCQLAYSMLCEGASVIEVIAALDCHKATFYRWQEEYPDFKDAIMRGMDKSEAFWTKMSQHKLETKGFNDRLYALNMMNRFGWNKKNESSHTVKISQEDALKALE